MSKQRKTINQKVLYRHIKNNIKPIITKDHDDAKTIIRNAGRKSDHVPLEMAAKTLRQLIVKNIGDKILETNISDAKSTFYEHHIKEYEKNCSFLKYHKDGIEEYDEFIILDISSKVQ